MNNTQLLLFEQFSSTEEATRQSAFCTLADRVLSPPPLWGETEQDAPLYVPTPTG